MQKQQETSAQTSNRTTYSWCFYAFNFREVIRDNNDTHCGLNQRCAQLNVAVGGAVNTQMPGQAENLVDKLQNDPDIEGDIDYENDWKLITMFIGGNDLCRSCQNEVTSAHTLILLSDVCRLQRQTNLGDTK